MFIHPEVLRVLAEGKLQDMQREQVRRARIATSRPAHEQADPTITLRLCRVGDNPALAKLADRGCAAPRR